MPNHQEHETYDEGEEKGRFHLLQSRRMFWGDKLGRKTETGESPWAEIYIF